MNDKDFHLALDERAFVCKAFGMFPLDDGIYDVVVVDAAGDPVAGGVHFELALTTGSHKGDIVRVRAINRDRDPLLALGLPGTVAVKDGAPSLTLE